MLKQICLAIWLCCGCAIAWGQPLADPVPDDAIVYVGWAGSGNVHGYDQSHLKNVLAATDAAVLIRETLPALLGRIQQEQGMDPRHVEIGWTLARYIWKYPSAMYITGIETSRPDDPRLRMGLIWDVGEDAAGLADRLRAMAAQDLAGKNIEVKSDGTFLWLLINHPDDGAGKLADAANFKTAMAAVQTDPTAAMYVDVPRALAAIDEMTKARAPEHVASWQKIEDAIGLTKIKALAWTGAFDGADWVTQSFISLPQAPTAAGSTVNAVDDAALKVIPRDATMCSAWEFSLGKFLDQMRTRLGTADPRYQQNYDKAMGVATAMTGVNIKSDFIDALGDQWAIFSAPEVAGNGLLGSVLVNRLADATSEQHALEALETAANNVMAGQFRRSSMTIAIKTMQQDGLTIHYLPVMMISPAWAIADKNLYVGLYPQAVAGAAAFYHQGGESILENQTFKQMRSAMATPPASCIHFVDIPATIDANYPAWLLISHYAGMADMYGIPGPAMLLPPIASLKKELAPSMSVGYWDQDGWHERSRSPFPGATILAGDPMTVSPIGTTALMAAIMLPSLNRSRETANRIKCGSNMRQIGQAMLLYSNEHQGKFPDDLGSLVITEEISAQVFVCPDSHTSAAGLANEAPEIQAAWIDKYSDYIYLGKGKNSSCSPDTILLSEKDSDHGDGMNLLFGDGHVDFVGPLAHAHQLIDDQLAGKK